MHGEIALEVAENLSKINADPTLGGRRVAPNQPCPTRSSSEVNALPPNVNPKDAIGRSKPSMHAVPPKPLFAIAATFKVLQYGLFNWREKPIRQSIYTDAIYRHLAAWRDGQDIDPDSGQSHMAHIAANSIIVMDATDYGTMIDDRWGKRS